jgi:ABC-type nitrate/sulfonate/bicarbonate transport system ATPase subunit
VAVDYTEWRNTWLDEVLRVWQDRSTTMLLVTHDIDEAIYMSDRIALLTPRPGRIG